MKAAAQVTIEVGEDDDEIDADVSNTNYRRALELARATVFPMTCPHSIITSPGVHRKEARGHRRRRRRRRRRLMTVLRCGGGRTTCAVGWRLEALGGRCELGFGNESEPFVRFGRGGSETTVEQDSDYNTDDEANLELESGCVFTETTQCDVVRD